MGSRFKKSVISENVRKSLSKWQRRVKKKHSSSYELLNENSTTSLESMLDGIIMDNSNSHCALISEEGSSSGTKDICHYHVDDENAPFPSYEVDHNHDVNDDLSPPLPTPLC
jgi:mlo protein